MKSVTVFGLGAIGSNLLVQLAKQYPDIEYTGIDFDSVEERNVRTQAYFLEHVGMKKAQAMRVVLARYLRRPKYHPVLAKVQTLERNHQADQLYIDCFDNSESRRLIGGRQALHLGFSPEYSAEFMWDDEDYEVAGDVRKGADICSMSDAIPFIHAFVNLSCLEISRWMETGERRNFAVTAKTQIKWLS